jgi:hypothetical protein
MAKRIAAHQAYRNRVVDGSIPSRGTTNFSENKKIIKRKTSLRKQR